LENNVNVTVLVPEESDHPIVKEAAFRYLRKILAKGGTVYLYQKGFFHAKILLFDNAVCDIGTANFDSRSFLLNYEINCFIHDKEFIRHAKQTVREDIMQSKRLRYQDLASLKAGARIKESIAVLFKGLL
jgi:cardiolipin synthase